MIHEALKSMSVLFCALIWVSNLNAQVYSPWVVKEGQPDTRDLSRLTQALYENAGAETDREKAEAIWRYLLTDGRFVKPGVFYHIAGWAYEEPFGEVLDPVKLLNSYGFGLCYQIAPLLEALWEAGGFPDARTWFLTGHTVTEVYFDGKYNMLDSDMLGYTTIGHADPRVCPIASVRELENDDKIILDKMLAADKVDTSKVVEPWYPADVQAKAMEGYVSLFSSQEDNWLFYFTRFPTGHIMDFVLRPGERLIRYFEPESEGLFYLPYKRVGDSLEEFPREVARYNIRTEDGPHSQRDSRLWATGRIHYTPPLSQESSYYSLFNSNLRLPSSRNEPLRRDDLLLPAVAVFEMPSPYVLINADFEFRVVLSTAAHHLALATSTDGGVSWQHAASLCGPFSGTWRVGPQVLAVSEHGVATAISGKYGYLVRLTLTGPKAGEVAVDDVSLTSLIQLNPRTLPAIESGENRLAFVPGPQGRHWDLPVDMSRISEFAVRLNAIEYFEENSNELLVPQTPGEEGEIIFEISAPDGSPLSGLHAGGRFLVLSEFGPEKLTAETRTTELRQDYRTADGSLSWSLSPEGPWSSLWEYSPPSEWLDNKPVDRLLLWPEVDRKIVELPPETQKAYVRYALKGMAVDGIRLVAFGSNRSDSSTLKITHEWYTRGSRISQSVEIKDPEERYEYVIHAPSVGEVKNRSIIFECAADGG